MFDKLPLELIGVNARFLKRFSAPEIQKKLLTKLALAQMRLLHEDTFGNSMQVDFQQISNAKERLENSDCQDHARFIAEPDHQELVNFFASSVNASLSYLEDKKQKLARAIKTLLITKLTGSQLLKPSSLPSNNKLLVSESTCEGRYILTGDTRDVYNQVRDRIHKEDFSNLVCVEQDEAKLIKRKQSTCSEVGDSLYIPYFIQYERQHGMHHKKVAFHSETIVKAEPFLFAFISTSDLNDLISQFAKRNKLTTGSKDDRKLVIERFVQQGLQLEALIPYLSFEPKTKFDNVVISLAKNLAGDDLSCNIMGELVKSQVEAPIIDEKTQEEAPIIDEKTQEDLTPNTYQDIYRALKDTQAVSGEANPAEAYKKLWHKIFEGDEDLIRTTYDLDHPYNPFCNDIKGSDDLIQNFLSNAKTDSEALEMIAFTLSKIALALNDDSAEYEEYFRNLLKSIEIQIKNSADHKPSYDLMVTIFKFLADLGLKEKKSDFGNRAAEDLIKALSLKKFMTEDLAFAIIKLGFYDDGLMTPIRTSDSTIKAKMINVLPLLMRIIADGNFSSVIEYLEQDIDLVINDQGKILKSFSDKLRVAPTALQVGTKSHNNFLNWLAERSELSPKFADNLKKLKSWIKTKKPDLEIFFEEYKR